MFRRRAGTLAAVTIGLATIGADRSAVRGTAPSTAEALLQAADDTRRFVSEGVLRVRATVEAAGDPPAVSEVEVFVRECDRALCVFRDGPLAGRRILMVEDRVWLLMPGTKRAIPMARDHRLFGGSSIADLARLRFASEFTAALRPEYETINGVPCSVLDLEARHRRAAYGSGTLWIGVQDRLPRRALLALPSGRPAKEIRFAGYKRSDGRMLLERMEVAHLLPSEQGMRTTLEFTGCEARSLPPDLFDPQRARELP